MRHRSGSGWRASLVGAGIGLLAVSVGLGVSAAADLAETPGPGKLPALAGMPGVESAWVVTEFHIDGDTAGTGVEVALGREATTEQVAAVLDAARKIDDPGVTEVRTGSYPTSGFLSAAPGPSSSDTAAFWVAVRDVCLRVGHACRIEGESPTTIVMEPSEDTDPARAAGQLRDALRNASLPAWTARVEFFPYYFAHASSPLGEIAFDHERLPSDALLAGLTRARGAVGKSSSVPGYVVTTGPSVTRPSGRAGSSGPQDGLVDPDQPPELHVLVDAEGDPEVARREFAPVARAQDMQLVIWRLGGTGQYSPPNPEIVPAPGSSSSAPAPGSSPSP